MRTQFEYEIRRNVNTRELEQWLIEVAGKRRMEYGPFESFADCRKIKNWVRRRHPEIKTGTVMGNEYPNERTDKQGEIHAPHRT